MIILGMGSYPEWSPSCKIEYTPCHSGTSTWRCSVAASFQATRCWHWSRRAHLYGQQQGLLLDQSSTEGDVAAAGFGEPREHCFVEVAVGGETWPDVSGVGVALAVRPLLHGLLLVPDDPLDLGLATAEGCCDGSRRLAAVVSLDDLDPILKCEDLALARHGEVVESLMIVRRMWQPCICCGLYPHSMERCHIISQWNALTQWWVATEVWCDLRCDATEVWVRCHAYPAHWHQRTHTQNQ